MSSINGSFGLIPCLKNGVADYAYGFAPLAPQFWGEQNYQAMQSAKGGFPHSRFAWLTSPPELGDQRGL